MFNSKTNIRKNRGFAQRTLDSILLPEIGKKSLRENFSLPVLIFYGIGWLFAIAGLGVNIYIMVTAATYHNWSFFTASIIALLIGAFIFYSISIGTLRAQKSIRIYKEDIKDGTLDNRRNYNYAILFVVMAVIALCTSISIQLFLAPFSAKSTTGVFTAEQKIKHFLDIDSIANQRENERIALNDSVNKKYSQLYKERLKNNPVTAAIMLKIEAEKKDFNRKIALQQKTISKKMEWSKSSDYSESKKDQFRKDIKYRENTILPKIEANHNERIRALNAELTNASKSDSDWFNKSVSSVSIANNDNSFRNKLTHYHDEMIKEQEQKAKTNEWITKGVACIFDIVSFLIFSWFGRKIVIDFTTHDIYSDTHNKKGKKSKPTSQQKSNITRNSSQYNNHSSNQRQKPLEAQKHTPKHIIRQQEAIKNTPTFEDLPKYEQERVKEIIQRARKEESKTVELELDDKTEQYLRKKEAAKTPPTPLHEVSKKTDTSDTSDTSDTVDTKTQVDTVDTNIYLPKEEIVKLKKSARTNYSRYCQLQEQNENEKAQKALETASKHIEKLRNARHIVQPVQGTGKLIIKAA